MSRTPGCPGSSASTPPARSLPETCAAEATAGLLTTSGTRPNQAGLRGLEPMHAGSGSLAPQAHHERQHGGHRLVEIGRDLLAYVRPRTACEPAERPAP